MQKLEGLHKINLMKIVALFLTFLFRGMANVKRNNPRRSTSLYLLPKLELIKVVKFKHNTRKLTNYYFGT